MKPIAFLLLLFALTSATNILPDRQEQTTPEEPAYWDETFPVHIGPFTVYGSIADFSILSASGLFGIAVDLAANYQFNLCLMDFARLIEMGYAAYYFWDGWWWSKDESEIVKAIIYAIEGWHVGFNLRCF